MPLVKYSDADLVRIDLPAPGEWVEVKRRLGKDDEKMIQRAALEGQRMEMGSQVATLDLASLFVDAPAARMLVAIKAWSFAEPVTKANILALDDDSVDAIIAWMDEHYEEGRTPEEAAPLGDSSPQPLDQTSQPPPGPQSSPGTQ